MRNINRNQRRHCTEVMAGMPEAYSPVFRIELAILQPPLKRVPAAIDMATKELKDRYQEAEGKELLIKVIGQLAVKGS